MLIDKRNLAAVEAASKGDYRLNLEVLYLEPDGHTIATDGHILARVGPPAVDRKEFPAVEPEGNTPVSDPFILPADDAKALLKALPKRPKMPFDACASISRNGKPELTATTAVEGSRAHREFSPVEGEFPDYTQVFPKGEPKTRVAFSIEKLERLLKIAKAVSDERTPAVVLELFETGDNASGYVPEGGYSGPMRVKGVGPEGSRFVGLIMPFRVQE